MPELLTPDLCIIGAGSGGLSVAAAAAVLGVPVVLIEKGKIGGTRLNTGCVPSKALLAAAKRAAAKRAEAFRSSAPFGIKPHCPQVEFFRVNDHVLDVIASIAPNDSKQRFAGLGVRVIEGEGRFKDHKTVAVGDGIEIKARRFVVATGSTPAVPPIPGLEQTPFLTSDTVFEARERPKHLIVVGAGPVGLELAQAFRRLGSDVTVLEAATPLAAEDPECAAVVLNRLGREGVAIRSGIKIARVRRVRNKIEVVLDTAAGEEIVEGSDLLIAAGRRSTVEGLGLDAAGIEAGPGGIKVDRTLRTTNKNVYAIGDVAGSVQFTHAANYHAGLVIRHALFRLRVKADANAIPRVIFTDPELAHVGLSEVQARERYTTIRVLRWPYHENDRAQGERETAGHIKVIVDKRGKVLGATIVGAAAGEQITAWTLAISQGLNIRAFAGIVVPYPTLSEVGQRAAISFFTPRLGSPWMRRILGWLQRLG